jgi:hypothetical protein
MPVPDFGWSSPCSWPREWTARPTSFEGWQGLWEQISQSFELGHFPDQGGGYLIPGTRVKYWPVEYNAQARVWATLKLRFERPFEDIADIDSVPWSAWYEISSKPVGWGVATRETADQPHYSGGDREHKPDHQEPQEIPNDRPRAWCPRI